MTSAGAGWLEANRGSPRGDDPEGMTRRGGPGGEDLEARTRRLALRHPPPLQQANPGSTPATAKGQEH